MAWELPVQAWSFEAAIDMSSSGNESTLHGQYRVMRSSAAGFIRYQENSSGTIIGVLQNAPIAGESASVVTYGVSKIWVATTAADIAVGETVTGTTNGGIMPVAAATNSLVGVALEPCTSGPLLISVLLSGPGSGGSTVSLFV